MISFIIPAYNEENNIGDLIESIRGGVLPSKYEIIIVDNDSNDSTSVIAASHFVDKIIHKRGGTVASLRNLGVNYSRGDVLIFLDADVTLTQEWFLNLPEAIEALSTNPRIITGSHCAAPDNSNWIEKYWFNNYVHEEFTTNIGTGHMITTREFFYEIGGFDESLVTGEDYQFCMSAIKENGKIINNPKLRVIHHDYPSNIINFIKREAWHGKGDTGTIKSIFRSKVAIASLIFLAMHMILLILIVTKDISNDLFILTIAGLGLLMLYSSYHKFSHSNFRIILVNSVIFYFYFVGRALSLFYIITKNIKTKNINR